MDWRNAAEQRDKDGNVGFAFPIYFMILASARVAGCRSDGVRAAIGLVLTKSSRHDYFYRVGVFVGKGQEGYGGMQTFDNCPTQSVLVD